MPALDYNQIAHLYDIYVAFKMDVPFFLEEAINTEGEVLELMAGTGRVSIPLIEVGVSLTCVDSSVEMLKILQNKLDYKGLKAHIYQQDISQLTLNQLYNLIFIPFNSFSELIGIEYQLLALEKISDHLEDNGRFICTLHNPTIRLKDVDGSFKLVGQYPIHDKKNYLKVWIASHYDPKKHHVNGVQIFEIMDKKGKALSRYKLPIHFTLFSKEEFGKLFSLAGLYPKSLYGDYQRSDFNEKTSPYMIWTLMKK
jgi:SAM-dependent methyltransferase